MQISQHDGGDDVMGKVNNANLDGLARSKRVPLVPNSGSEECKRAAIQW
jgi:hypothetical protein